MNDRKAIKLNSFTSYHALHALLERFDLTKESPVTLGVYQNFHNKTLLELEDGLFGFRFGSGLPYTIIQDYDLLSHINTLYELE